MGAAVDLTVESALSGNSLLGHLAYVLLTISMLMRRMVWLRIFVILSALSSIAYFGVILRDPVSVFWETLLISVNVAQLGLIWWLDRRTQFDERESRMIELHFKSVPRRRMRRLIDRGVWKQLPAQAQLTRQGTPVPALYYLAAGEAQVLVNGGLVATCATGSFVGEMTALTGEPAFATVEASEPLDVWMIPAGKLRSIVSEEPESGRAIEAAFFRVVRERLVQQNARRSPSAPALTVISRES